MAVTTFSATSSPRSTATAEEHSSLNNEETGKTKFLHTNPVALLPHEILPNEIFRNEFIQRLSPKDVSEYVNSLFNKKTGKGEVGKLAQINLFQENLRGIYELTPEQFTAYKNSYHKLSSKDVSISNAKFLSLFKSLRTLELNNALATPEIFNVLQNIPTITHLNLKWCTQIEDLFFLQHLPNLTHLKFSWCTQIEDFSFLQLLPNLTHLDLTGCGQIQDLSFLKFLPNLTHLDLSNCRQIQDLSFLRHLPHLSYLGLVMCWQIKDFSFLRHLPHLSHLGLVMCWQIKDWSIFNAYPHIQIDGRPDQ